MGTSEPVVRVTGFDHVVLRSADVERSLAWWTGELGLAGVRVDEWRRGDVPFPSVRVDGTTIIDLLAGKPDGRNVDHVCLVVEPGGVARARASGRFRVHHDDPDARPFGARGHARSIYVLDPDDHVVELREY